MSVHFFIYLLRVSLFFIELGYIIRIFYPPFSKEIADFRAVGRVQTKLEVAITLPDCILFICFLHFSKVRL